MFWASCSPDVTDAVLGSHSYGCWRSFYIIVGAGVSRIKYASVNCTIAASEVPSMQPGRPGLDLETLRHAENGTRPGCREPIAWWQCGGRRGIN